MSDSSSKSGSDSDQKSKGAAGGDDETAYLDQYNLDDEVGNDDSH